MKRAAGSMVVLVAMSGCLSDGPARPMPRGSCCGGHSEPIAVPGVQGPYGQPIAMCAPYNAAPPSGEALARDMINQSVPMDMVQQQTPPRTPTSNGIMQTSFVDDGSSGIMPATGCGRRPPGGLPPQPLPPGAISPPGVPFGPGMPVPDGMPGTMGPAMMGPGGLGPMGMGAGPMGPMGMGGPGPMGPMGMGGPGPMGPSLPPPGVVAAAGPLVGGPPAPFPTHRTEVRFVSPTGMKVSWYTAGADGKPGFGTQQIDAPGRYNFTQGAIYRLKLSSLPNRPGLDLYPTLEVVPSNIKTDSYLAHSAVPVFFTEEDLDQVAGGNYLVKVIYLPNPLYADQAMTGPDEIVSTRLEPGLDPIVEAAKRGSILLVIRLGNIDLELPNSPSMDAPSPFVGHGAPGPMGPMMPGAMGGMGPMAPGGMTGMGPMVPGGMGGPMMPGAMGGAGPMMPGAMGGMGAPGAMGPMMPGAMGPMMPGGMPGAPGAMGPTMPGMPGASAAPGSKPDEAKPGATPATPTASGGASTGMPAMLQGLLGIPGSAAPPSLPPAVPKPDARSGS